mgnify:CR=1 FL=1
MRHLRGFDRTPRPDLLVEEVEVATVLLLVGGLANLVRVGVRARVRARVRVRVGVRVRLGSG